jgi:DNA-binding GntR family transcriptional regulator
VTEANGQSLVRQAYARIEDLIITLALEPGAIATEARIAEAIGMGRTPVREALQQLVREGLVEVLPKRGIRIARIDPGKQLRMLEFRRQVERFIARSAALNATETERQAFGIYAAQFREVAITGDNVVFIGVDDAFTAAMANCSANEYASDALKLTHGLSRRFANAFDFEVDGLRTNAIRHADLATAISEGNAERAVEKIDALIDGVVAFTRSKLQR